MRIYNVENLMDADKIIEYKRDDYHGTMILFYPIKENGQTSEGKYEFRFKEMSIYKPHSFINGILDVIFNSPEEKQVLSKIRELTSDCGFGDVQFKMFLDDIPDVIFASFGDKTEFIVTEESITYIGYNYGSILAYTRDEGRTRMITSDIYRLKQFFEEKSSVVRNEIAEKEKERVAHYITYHNDRMISRALGNCSINQLPQVNCKQHYDEMYNNLSPEEQHIMFSYSGMLSFIDGIANLSAVPIGLDNVTKQVESMTNRVKYEQFQKTLGVDVEKKSLNMCFLGNPGTGKTTVARLLTSTLYECGYIKYNECIEINAQHLKGAYVGQTATITKILLNFAKGRVLFIDEAYTLLDSYENGYGKEAVSVILKEMEDNRGDFVIIFAGYEKEMQDFLDINPGLRSRIDKYIHFANYSAIDLFRIFLDFLNKEHLAIQRECAEQVFDFIKSTTNISGFSNARFVRNLYDKMYSEHCYRYYSKKISEDYKYIMSVGDLTEKIMTELTTMSR